MPVEDLREWINRVEELGELTRIEGVDPNLELGGLVDLYMGEMDYGKDKMNRHVIAR